MRKPYSPTPGSVASAIIHVLQYEQQGHNTAISSGEVLTRITKEIGNLPKYNNSSITQGLIILLQKKLITRTGIRGNYRYKIRQVSALDTSLDSSDAGDSDEFNQASALRVIAKTYVINSLERDLELLNVILNHVMDTPLQALVDDVKLTPREVQTLMEAGIK